MSKFNFLRPDKILFTGLKAVGDSLYSLQKSQAKGEARLTFIGEKRIDDVDAQLFIYNADKAEEVEKAKGIDILNKINKDSIVWLNYHGLHEVEHFEKIAKDVKLDRLTLRQILDTTQRPKVEEFDDYLFFSVKSIQKTKAKSDLEIEQLSFVLFNGYLLSFQEQIGDHFDYIRNKITDDLGLIRKKKADYLLVQLIDSIVDNYFETIDELIKGINELETKILRSPDNTSLLEIEKYKRQVRTIKSSLSPLIESINTVLNGKTKFIEDENIKYFKDIRNSCSSALDQNESINSSLESLTNIYFASLSQKMNQIMKVLTLVSTIFIPLTFIAGIYGMNFEYMPELKYHNAYFIVWGVMISVMIGMAVLFKVKKWL